MTTTDQIEGYILDMAQGDQGAFEKLYAATSAKLFGVSLRVLGNRAEAEDAVQEAYIKIWRNADRFTANGFSPMTWLITVTRNHAIDRLRARKAPTQDIDEAYDLADAAPGPEAQAITAADRARIVDCMSGLEEQKADAVRRAYLEGDTYQDLAEAYGIPLNTIRTWLRRSLLKLRECLSQ